MSDDNISIDSPPLYNVEYDLPVYNEANLCLCDSDPLQCHYCHYKDYLNPESDGNSIHSRTNVNSDSVDSYVSVNNNNNNSNGNHRINLILKRYDIFLFVVTVISFVFWATGSFIDKWVTFYIEGNNTKYETTVTLGLFHICGTPTYFNSTVMASYYDHYNSTSVNYACYGLSNLSISSNITTLVYICINSVIYLLLTLVYPLSFICYLQVYREYHSLRLLILLIVKLTVFFLGLSCIIFHNTRSLEVLEKCWVLKQYDENNIETIYVAEHNTSHWLIFMALLTILIHPLYLFLKVILPSNICCGP